MSEQLVNENDQRRKEFLEYRSLLLHSLNDGYRSFDRSLSFLSAGGIGIVLTAAELGSGIEKLEYLSALAFGMALIINLISYMFSIHLKRAEIEEWDEREIARAGGAHGNESKKAPLVQSASSKCLGAIVMGLNYFALGVFFLGIVLISVGLWNNVSGN